MEEGLLLGRFLLSTLAGSSLVEMDGLGVGYAAVSTRVSKWMKQGRMETRDTYSAITLAFAFARGMLVPSPSGYSSSLANSLR